VALFELHQQPALFERGRALPAPLRLIEHQRLGFAQRQDHRIHRVPPQLPQGADPPKTVDHQVPVLLSGPHHDDRRLLPVEGQRPQQPLLLLRPLQS
jgi:hypothetical protein